jgi:hypothetical protein
LQGKTGNTVSRPIDASSQLLNCETDRFTDTPSGDFFRRQRFATDFFESSLFIRRKPFTISAVAKPRISHDDDPQPKPDPAAP